MRGWPLARKTALSVFIIILAATSLGADESEKGIEYFAVGNASSEWLSGLRAQLYKETSVPEWMPKEPLEAALLLRLELDQHGNILSRRIEKSSGIQFVDDTVLRAVDNAPAAPQTVLDGQDVSVVLLPLKIQFAPDKARPGDPDGAGLCETVPDDGYADIIWPKC